MLWKQASTNLMANAPLTRSHSLRALLAPKFGRTASRFYHKDQHPDSTFDVVVVGSGAAGLTAALTAATKAKLRVLVIEKTGFFGGTTAYSGGALWIPGNPKMTIMGMPDSRNEAEAYVQECVGAQTPQTSAYLDSGPEMIDWIENNSVVRFLGVPIPDYHMSNKGARFGRTVMTAPYDGRRLGSLVRKVRYPLQGMCAFGSMQINLSEISKWKKPFSNFGFCAKGLARYAVDMMRYGKGTALYNGNALIGSLLESAVGAGVTLWDQTSAVEPIMRDGRIGGLVLSHNNTTIKVQARKGVVLASGGFSRSSELSRKYLPNSGAWTAACRGNQGDGLQIGLASGGGLGAETEDHALWSPISQYHPRRGPTRYFPHLALDRSKPGSIIVDGDGKRFANESGPYQPLGHITNKLGVQKEYLIGDSNFLKRYGMGLALPSPYPIGHFIRRGYIHKAPTIAELGHKLGIDKSALLATIDRFNNFARQGKDLDFQRGESIYDQANGDAEVGPNPCLAPLETGPFYALPMYPGNVATFHGLQTNTDAQVLNKHNEPVPGLFAIGSDQDSIMQGKYPGGGSAIGPGMVFGYRAGSLLAEL